MSKIDFVKQKIPFTQVANGVLRDERLSFKAKGLYAFLYSKPDGWDFESNRIAKESKDGRDSVRAGIEELEKYGYLKRCKQPDGRMVYMIIFPPMTENPSQEPMTEKPNDGKTHSGKTRHISNKEIKVIKNISNKEVAETSSAPFNLKEYIQKCYNDKNRHIQLIGLYMDYRYDSLVGKIKTVEQAREVIKRHVRSAKNLLKWDDQQINKAIADVNKKNSDIDWTLETLHKHLTK